MARGEACVGRRVKGGVGVKEGARASAGRAPFAPRPGLPRARGSDGTHGWPTWHRKASLSNPHHGRMTMGRRPTVLTAQAREQSSGRAGEHAPPLTPRAEARKTLVAQRPSSFAEPRGAAPLACARRDALHKAQRTANTLAFVGKHPRPRARERHRAARSVRPRGHRN